MRNSFLSDKDFWAVVDKGGEIIIKKCKLLDVNLSDERYSFSFIIEFENGDTGVIQATDIFDSEAKAITWKEQLDADI